MIMIRRDKSVATVNCVCSARTQSSTGIAAGWTPLSVLSDQRETGYERILQDLKLASPWILRNTNLILSRISQILYVCAFLQSSFTDPMNITAKVFVKSKTPKVYHWLSLPQCIYLHPSFITIACFFWFFSLNGKQLSILVYCYIKLCCVLTSPIFSCNFWQLEMSKTVLFPLWQGAEVQQGVKMRLFRVDEIRSDET